MKLIKYRTYSNSASGLNFSEISMKKLNLFVGNSGSGKTRMLNTMFNLAIIVTRNELKIGTYDIIFQEENKNYKYFIEIISFDNKISISKESLEDLDTGKMIFNRNGETTEFLDKKIPKVSQLSSLINVFREEPLITPVFNGFQKLVRKSFDSDILNQASEILVTSQTEIKRIEKEVLKNVAHLYQYEPLSLKLEILKNVYPKLYETIVNAFVTTFNFIERIEVRITNVSFGLSPIIYIYEEDSKTPIMLNDMSSGIKKVLLFITDLLTLPDGFIYLIDEYENSLGINAINILPQIIKEMRGNCQLIITSHHPYLINHIPIENWFLFIRKGTNVEIIEGEVLKKKYSSSSQEKFIQLINDPLYLGER